MSILVRTVFGSVVITSIVGLGLLGIHPTGVDAAGLQPLRPQYPSPAIYLSASPCRYYAKVGDQICYTITVQNLTDMSLSGMRMMLRFEYDDINFFLSSHGGEIHPGQVTWFDFSLQPREVKNVKLRSQILRVPANRIVRVTAMLDGQRSNTDVHIMGLMPESGVENSFFEPLTDSSQLRPIQSSSEARAEEFLSGR
jgi:hypothetical protein